MGGAPPGSRKKGKDATELQLEQLVDARDVAVATGAVDPEAGRRTEIVPIADVRCSLPPFTHAAACMGALRLHATSVHAPSLHAHAACHAIHMLSYHGNAWAAGQILGRQVHAAWMHLSFAQPLLADG